MSEAPPSVSVGAAAHCVATTSDGQFVYVGTDSGIAAFKIDSSGNLTPVSGSPFALSGSGASDMSVDHSGKFLFVVFSGSNMVASYPRDPAAGTLSPPTTEATGSNPSTLTAEASGKYLYVSNRDSSNISEFAIANGVLSPVAGSPISDAPEPSPVTGSGPIVAAGSHVYVISDGWLLGYSTDGATGALMALPGQNGQAAGILLPLNTVIGEPHAMVADPNGNFLVTANETPDTSPNFTQVIPVSSTTGSVMQGSTQQGVSGAAAISPLAIDAAGQHVNGVGFTDQTCVQNCACAVYSFSVSASSISEIGSGGVDVGSHGNDAIATSSF